MRKKINCEWIVITGKWNGQEFIDIQEKSSRRDIEMKIILKDNRAIIRFIGGPTSYEAFYISNFRKNLYNHTKTQKLDKWYICMGTINRWPRCIVDRREVMQFIREIIEDKLCLKQKKKQ